METELRRPNNATPVSAFLLHVCAVFGLPEEGIRAAVKTLTEKGLIMVGQLKSSTKRIVQDATRHQEGLYDVICIAIVPDGDDPHEFEVPQPLPGHDTPNPRTTGGVCGSSPERQLNMVAIMPPAMTSASISVMQAVPRGVLSEVLRQRMDFTAPVIGAHVSIIVANMAHVYMLLFGCMYIASAAPGDRGRIPAQYLMRICKLVVEYFVHQGFRDAVNTNNLYYKVKTRVNPEPL